MGLKYSGKYSFVQTNYVYPSTHMVAPAEDALRCTDCHQKEGRLKKMAGFYMPGRDRNMDVETFGWLTVFFAFLGVASHGIRRVRVKYSSFMAKRLEKKDE